jgi:hypothetical protein
MTKAEEIVTKVSRDLQQLIQLVKGNGTVKGSVLGRIDELEVHSDSYNERLLVVEAFPCSDGCLFEGHINKEEEVQNRKRTFRISDVANYIQLAVLLLIVYGMFLQ